jgi:hypothetical protein
MKLIGRGGATMGVERMKTTFMAIAFVATLWMGRCAHAQTCTQFCSPVPGGNGAQTCTTRCQQHEPPPKLQQIGCFYHCNPDGYSGTVCHWNCY